MASLIHLNGPPGIGKSTLARRYADEHLGVLNCDIDVLRVLIGGYSRDFQMTGTLIRPAALAMIEAYLMSGHDVVLPQMLADPSEVQRFESCATRAKARFVERFLMDESERAVERFDRRGEADPSDPWHAQVRDIIAAGGGEAELRRWYRALQELLARRPEAIVVHSVEGAIDDTYQRLLASLP